MLASLLVTLLFVPAPHWDFSGPIFGGTPAGTLETCDIGYGDRAVQGFHAGLDFTDPNQTTGSYVLSPANQPWYAIGIPWAQSSSPDNQIVCFGTDNADTWGWSYGHINFPNPRIWYHDYHTSAGIPKQTLAMTTSLTYRHIHVAWVPAWFDQIPDIELTYHNPFDWIESVPTGYQVVQFARVRDWETEIFGSSSLSKGIIVLPDGDEAFNDDPSQDRTMFQRVFNGAVDFVVNPLSVTATSFGVGGKCGVRQIAYDIVRQNIYSPQLICPIQSNRIVFTMNGTLPYDNSADMLEYQALFADEGPDGPIVGPFFNNYIITNSGDFPTGETGIDNIVDYPSVVSHDWQESHYNIGGLDTRLREMFGGGGSQQAPTAYVNEHSIFCDGRYWVNVTATTQDGVSRRTATLPAIDCYANPIIKDPRGFLIDNFYPHVDSIIVYQLSPFSVRFRGGWTTSDSADPIAELRVQNAIDNWSLFDSGQSTIGVAVKYSEKMNEDDLGCVWLTGGGTTAEPIFNSLYLGEEGILYPAPWRTILGELNPTSSHYWVCYETETNWPGYVGQIRVHIGSPDGSSVPKDLTGNPIDTDPETVASPIWMNTTAGYEVGFADTLHSWGDIDIWCKPTTWPPDYRIRGYRFPPLTFVTEVHLIDDLGLSVDMNPSSGPFDGEYQIHGICPDWGGFWLQHWYDFEKPPFVYLARPTGPDEWDSFQLSIPTSDEMIWYNAVNTQSGRYLFVFYYDQVVVAEPPEIESCTGHLVCYSALPTASGVPLGISSNQISIPNHIPSLNPQLGLTGEEIIVNWEQLSSQGGGGFQQTYHVSQFFDLDNNEIQSSAPLQPDLTGDIHIEEGNAVIHLSWSGLESSSMLCAGDGSQLLHQVFRCFPASGEIELLGLAYPGVSIYTDRFPAVEHSSVEYWVTAVDGGQESEPSVRLLFDIPQGSNVALGKPVCELFDMASLVSNRDAAGFRTEAQGNPWCLTDGRLDGYYRPSPGAHSVEIDLGAVHTITSVIVQREDQSSSTLSDASLMHMVERGSLSSRTDLGEDSLRTRFLRIACVEGASEILVFGREDIRDHQRVTARRGGDGNWIINVPQSDRASFCDAAGSGSESLEGTLTLFDLAGRVVWTLNALHGSDVLWDGRTETGSLAPNGIYLVHFECSGNVTTGRIMIVDP